MRERGSHGGHNGMRSLIDTLGTEEFARLRIGVKRGDLPDDLADYVHGARIMTTIIRRSLDAGQTPRSR